MCRCNAYMLLRVYLWGHVRTVAVVVVHGAHTYVQHLFSLSLCIAKAERQSCARRWALRCRACASCEAPLSIHLCIDTLLTHCVDALHSIYVRWHCSPTIAIFALSISISILRPQGTLNQTTKQRKATHLFTVSIPIQGQQRQQQQRQQSALAFIPKIQYSNVISIRCLQRLVHGPHCH